MDQFGTKEKKNKKYNKYDSTSTLVLFILYCVDNVEVNALEILWFGVRIYSQNDKNKCTQISVCRCSTCLSHFYFWQIVM